MPRLNQAGSALMGYAGAILSIDGDTPAAFSGLVSGGWAWLDATHVIGQLETAPSSDVFQFQSYDVASPALTLLQNFGSFYTSAGGGNWALWNAAQGGVLTNNGLGPFPAGFPLNHSYAGEFALLQLYQSGSGIRIYSPTGILIDQLNVTISYNGLSGSCPVYLRDNICAYTASGLGFRLRDYQTRENLSFLQRDDFVDWMIPILSGGDLWLLERRNSDGLLTLREALSTTAWDLATPAGQTFQPDAILLSPGVVRVAWSTDAGESRTALQVLDVTLATGANDLGVVVGTSLSFSAQAALGTISVSGSVIPGSSGGGSGGSFPGSGGTPGPGSVPSPGRTVLAERAAPPPSLKEPRRYPHVDQIDDFFTKRSLKLAWDRLGDQTEEITSLRQQLATQEAVNQELRDAIAAINTKINAGTVPEA